MLKRQKLCVPFMGNPLQSYGASPATRDRLCYLPPDIG